MTFPNRSKLAKQALIDALSAAAGAVSAAEPAAAGPRA